MLLTGTEAWGTFSISTCKTHFHPPHTTHIISLSDCVHQGGNDCTDPPFNRKSQQDQSEEVMNAISVTHYIQREDTWHQFGQTSQLESRSIPKTWQGVHRSTGRSFREADNRFNFTTQTSLIHFYWIPVRLPNLVFMFICWGVGRCSINPFKILIQLIWQLPNKNKWGNTQLCDRKTTCKSQNLPQYKFKIQHEMQWQRATWWTLKLQFPST